MVDARKMLADYECQIAQLDFIKFSDISNLIKFREYLHKITNEFNKLYPTVKITSKEEIINKTTIKLKARFSTTDYFYPYRSVFELTHEYHVFSRGKRNEEMVVKLPLELINIAVAESLKCMGVDTTIFDNIKKVGGRTVFSKEQREVIDHIDKLTWGSYKFQDIKTVIIEKTWSNPENIPVFLNRHWWNKLKSVNTVKAIPKAKPEKKTEVKKEEAVASCCFNCKKWCSSRNSIEMQKQNRTEAPCPVVGKRTKNTDHCGKFRKI